MLRNLSRIPRYVGRHAKGTNTGKLFVGNNGQQIRRLDKPRYHSGNAGNWRVKGQPKLVWKCAVLAVGTAVGIKFWVEYSTPCLAASQPESEQIERRYSENQSLEEAIDKCKDILQRVKDETGSPGIVVAVSVDGRNVWSQGLGYADIENRVQCSPDTVMRIASISKSLTSAIVGRMMEAGKLDIDKPVQEYVPKFPQKFVDGEKVTLTTRHALTHLGGIRHYSKDYIEKGKKDEKDGSKTKKSGDKSDKAATEKSVSEMKQLEYYIKESFKTVEEGMNLFKEDPLVHKPGSKFLYSSHGFTLVSAVLEGASNKTFRQLLLGLFKDIGLQYTYLDENDPLIYNRSRNYVKTEKGILKNAPYVDNSYKWAGGGLLSTVGDLVKFGNMMLYSYQFVPADSENNNKGNKIAKKIIKSKTGKDSNSPKLQKSDNELSGYLKRSTVEELWRPAANTECSWDSDGGYALGWAVVPEQREHGCCRNQPFYVSHTGAAIGASSILLIVPQSGADNSQAGGDNPKRKGDKPPSGIVVAVMSNMISLNLRNAGVAIAREFENVTEG